MKKYLCCTKCKGMMPAFRCKQPYCGCHEKQMRIPENGRPSYRDPTANQAIGNLPAHMKGANK